MNSLELVSKWITSIPDHHSLEAYDIAEKAFIDAIGCILSGSNSDVSRKTRSAIQDCGIGKSTIMGTDLKLASSWAAFANGVSGNAFDYNDCDLISLSHISVVLFPALIAVAEEMSSSAKEILDSYIIGVEIIMKVGEVIGSGLFNQGWHPTPILGALGATAACCRLMKLPPEQTASALSLVTSMIGGYNSQIGAMAKPIHVGLAAKNGVIASKLAATGISASMETLDGKWSLCTLSANVNPANLRDVLLKLGNPLGIVQHGLTMKFYPCCVYLQNTIEGILKLCRNYQIDRTGIIKVVVKIPSYKAEYLPYIVPETISEAMYSTPYCIAAAISKNELTLFDFTPEALKDKEVLSLIPIISMLPYPLKLSEVEGHSEHPDIVEIHLKDGRVLTEKIIYSKGSTQSPGTRNDIIAKFHACIAYSPLNSKKSSEIETKFCDLQSIKDISELTALLSI